MDDIFEEIAGEMRAERNRAWVRRFGGPAAAAVLVAVACVAGWQTWVYYQARQNQSVAQVYLTAMQDADGAATGLAPSQNPAQAHAIDGFAEVASHGPDGYRTLARLREASLQADRGDLAAATQLWTAVSADGSTDQLLRDLATLTMVEHQIDSGNPEQLRSLLAPLTVALNPWHGLAQEAEALLDLRQGQTDAAKRLLQGLAQDAATPAGLRGRANSMLARLGA